MKLTLVLSALLLSAAVSYSADEKKPKATPEEQFKKLDTNSDGFLSKEEFLASPRAKKDPAAAEKQYAAMDKKGDGKVSLEDFKAGMHKKKDK